MIHPNMLPVKHGPVPLVWIFIRGAKVAGAGGADMRSSAARMAGGGTRGGMS